MADLVLNKENPPGYVRAFDVRTGKLVWMGEGRGKLNAHVIETVVAAVLKQYPPPPEEAPVHRTGGT